MNILTFPVRIRAILEHHRTIRGGKDSLGQMFTEQVNLGWFLHLELPDGEPFGVALGLGSEIADLDVKVGDELLLKLSKVT
jgi:hypothetical protein